MGDMSWNWIQEVEIVESGEKERGDKKGMSERENVCYG
jgi:hypothetical protein